MVDPSEDILKCLAENNFEETIASVGEDLRESTSSGRVSQRQ